NKQTKQKKDKVFESVGTSIDMILGEDENNEQWQTRKDSNGPKEKIVGSGNEKDGDNLFKNKCAAAFPEQWWQCENCHFWNDAKCNRCELCASNTRLCGLRDNGRMTTHPKKPAGAEHTLKCPDPISIPVAFCSGPPKSAHSSSTLTATMQRQAKDFKNTEPVACDHKKAEETLTTRSSCSPFASYDDSIEVSPFICLFIFHMSNIVLWTLVIQQVFHVGDRVLYEVEGLSLQGMVIEVKHSLPSVVRIECEELDVISGNHVVKKLWVSSHQLIKVCFLLFFFFFAFCGEFISDSTDDFQLLDISSTSSYGRIIDFDFEEEEEEDQLQSEDPDLQLLRTTSMVMYSNPILLAHTHNIKRSIANIIVLFDFYSCKKKNYYNNNKCQMLCFFSLCQTSLCLYFVTVLVYRLRTLSKKKKIFLSQLKLFLLQFREKVYLQFSDTNVTNFLKKSSFTSMGQKKNPEIFRIQGTVRFP
ncbi:hypothetical protein RFI_27309, partial [Reticulomyxa filosa]